MIYKVFLSIRNTWKDNGYVLSRNKAILSKILRGRNS